MTSERPDTYAHGVSAEGRITSRPTRPARSGSFGKSALGLSTGRDGYVYAPRSCEASRATPLVVFFHGAGGEAGQGDMLLPVADELGFVLLSIDARSSTWDVIRSDFGVDVAFLDRALHETFARHFIDETRVTVSGFSDGASYALSVGLTNGDLVDNIVAFSPGFMAPGELRDRPRVFLSHGDDDRVLPVDRCSRRLVSKLRTAGYDVTYDEFKGPHTVPAEIALRGMRWALTGRT